MSIPTLREINYVFNNEDNWLQYLMYKDVIKIPLQCEECGSDVRRYKQTQIRCKN